MKWINTKRFDLFFFIPVWFPILFCLVSIQPDKGGVVAAIPLAIYLAYHALIRLPHFFITLPIIYWRDQKGLQWFLYYAVPLLILCSYGFFARHATAWETTVWKLLIVIGFVWGWFHIIMQNYGFQRLYLRINNSRLIGSRVYGIIFGAFILAKVVIAIRFFLFANGLPLLFRPILETIDFVLLASTLHLVYLKCVKFKEALSTADCFFGLTVLMLLDWPRYIGLGQMNYFYLFNVHHCLAYLGISYLLSRNESAGAPAFRRLYPALIALSVGLIVSLIALDKDFLNARLADDSEFHPLFVGLFVVHYYLDGIAWKVRKGHLSLNRFILARQG